MSNWSGLRLRAAKLFKTSPRRSTVLRGRRPLFEMLEARHMLTASGFPGNDCPPDLDLSAITQQQAVVGQPFMLDLVAAGGTVEDLTTEGESTGDTIRWLLDPDIPEDTPVGATITTSGVFNWTPTQAGTFRIVVIAVDQGTPPLADAETFTIEVVTEGNQAPVVDLNGPDTGTGFSATFTEGDEPVAAVGANLTVDDTDDEELESARIVLTNHPDGTSESLSIDVTGTDITAEAYDPATGELLLTGTATLADYQLVLRTLTYSNTSQDPTATPRSIEVTVNDGTVNSAIVVSTVQVVPVNDLATVDLNGGDTGTGFTTMFTEGGPAILIVDTDLAVEDVDDANLASATVRIINLLDEEAELLSVVEAGNIVAEYDDQSGVLTLTGSDTRANYEQVLRSLRYQNTSQNPDTTPRSITVVVNDGAADGPAATATVNINRANTPPDIATISNFTAFVGQDIALLVTATDPDSDILTFLLDPDTNQVPPDATIEQTSNTTAIIHWTPDETDIPGPVGFRVLVNDNGTPTRSDAQAFSVTVANPRPVVDLNGDDPETGFTSMFTEGDADVVIVDTDLTVSSFNNVNIASARAEITNLLDEAAETLSVDVGTTGIVSSYDAGVLTLTGSATATDYEQVLRTLRYSNSSQDPGTSRAIEVTVNDGTNDSLAAIATVTIGEVNDRPNLTLPPPYDDPETPVPATVGANVTFTVTTVDPDHSGSELTYLVDADDPGGVPPGATQPTISQAGVFSWTPDTAGEFTIRILVTDAAGDVDQQEVTFTVTQGTNQGFTLAETNQFATEREESVLLGQSTGRQTLSFDLSNVFDTSDQTPILDDTLNVYLVDAANPSTTLLDGGEPGTPVFSISPDGAEYLPGLVRFDGTTVEIDVSSVVGVTDGLLRFQLLGGDSDNGTSFSIGPITSQTDDTMTPGPVLGLDMDSVSPGGSVDLSGYTATADMQVLAEHVHYDSETGEYVVNLRLENQGAALGRRLAVLLPGLPSEVTVTNQSGVNDMGVPYINFLPAIDGGGLDIGETSAAIELLIANPQGVRFSLIPTVLAGPSNRAPVATAISAIELVPGDYLDVSLNVDDPDGDPLTYTLQPGVVLPTGMLTNDGRIILTPAPGEEGTYPIGIGVSDGVETVTQTIDVTIQTDPINTTRVSGVLLSAFDPQDPGNGNTPALADVQVEMGGEIVLTDASGNFSFEFDTVPSDLTLKIHPKVYSPTLKYPPVAEPIHLLLDREIYENAKNVIGRPTFLPPLDLASEEMIDPVAGGMVENPNIPGLMLNILPNSLRNGDGSMVPVGELVPFTITSVPIEQTPAALPGNFRPDLVLTIQPGGMTFRDGAGNPAPAPITFPNTANYPLGTLLDLYSIDPNTGTFADAGDMEVVSDGAGGTIIETISGGIINSSWHFPAPPPDMMNDDDDGDEDDDCDECKATGDGPSEIELHSGAYLENHSLVTYQSLGQTRGFGLHYDSKRADPRPIVFFGYSNVNPGATRRIIASVEVERGNFMYQVPGHAGGEYGLLGGEHIWNVPTTAGPVRGALQIDLRDAPTGVYNYDLTTGVVNFDGTMFAGSTQTTTKELSHVNFIDSPFGAGWGLTGLERIYENPDGSILLVDGGGSELFFDAPTTAGEPYVSPPGDFSTLMKLGDNTFQRTMTDQTVYLYDINGRITSITDRNDNVTQFLYDASGIIERIIDPVDLATVFASNGGRITSITDPANRVTQLEYDSDGNLMRVTDPDGTFRTWDYDDDHHIVEELDKLGRTEITDYNFAGRVEHAVLADGTEMFYDPVQTQYLKHPTATTNPLNPPVIDRLVPISATFSDANGNATEVMLDKQGQSIGARDTAGNLPFSRRNEENLVSINFDSRNNPTTFDYDDRGNVVSIADTESFGGRFVDITQTGMGLTDIDARDDDSVLVDLPFTFDFYGVEYSQVGISTNGLIRMGGTNSEYTNQPLETGGIDVPAIYVWWDDLDTRSNTEIQGRIFTQTLGSEGNRRFIVQWNDVEHYQFTSQTGTVTFQAILHEGTNRIEFNYEDVHFDGSTETNNGAGRSGTIGIWGAPGQFQQWSHNTESLRDGMSLIVTETGIIEDTGLGDSGPQQFEYDATYSQVTSFTDELGHITLFEIDPTTGNRTKTTHVVGEIDSIANGETDDLVTSVTYTSQGLIDTVTDPLGRVTNYDYNTQGRLESVTYAMGTADEATISYEYDLAGNQTAMIDGNGNRTVYEYDDLNRLTRSIEADPDGPGPLTSPITEIDYDALGNVATATDARGNTTSNVYDNKNRLIQSTGPDPDSAGPLVAPVTTYAYDLAGNLASMTDPNGNATEYRYDSRNRRIEMIDPDGGSTRFAYDADGNLTRVTDPVGNVTRFVYDARNRLIEETDPLDRRISYTYDAANNLTSKVDRNGRETRYEYDDLNRLVTEEWVGPNDTAINTVSYAYDAASNLLSVEDTFSSLTYTYDARNRVKTVDNLGTPDVPNVVLTYAYDDNSNVVSVIDTIGGAAGATTGYEYDGLDRLLQLTQNGTGLSDKRVDFAYNPLGQYASINRYSDLVATQLVIGTDYTYDDQNRLTRIDHKNSASATVAFYDYVYDLASRITQIVDVDGTTTYSYDDRDQLTGADHSDVNQTDETYQYDANGNRVNSHLHDNGYVTGEANRLTSDGTYDYEYDDEGNMTRRTEIATDNYRVFQWDHRNRLIAANDFLAGGTAVQTVEFTYDTINRRISKAVDDTPLDAVDAAITQFVYDREDVILDFVDADGSGPGASVLDERYLHGAGVDQVFAQDDANGSVEWLLTDHLGTTRDLVDNSGAVANHIAYEAFGKVASQTDANLGSRYLYTGREFDSETNLHFYRARYYDSIIGLFFSNDPKGIAGDLNLYRYVQNRPNQSTDPLGRESIPTPTPPPVPLPSPTAPPYTPIDPPTGSEFDDFFDNYEPPPSSEYPQPGLPAIWCFAKCMVASFADDAAIGALGCFTKKGRELAAKYLPILAKYGTPPLAIYCASKCGLGASPPSLDPPFNIGNV